MQTRRFLKALTLTTCTSLFALATVRADGHQRRAGGLTRPIFALLVFFRGN